MPRDVYLDWNLKSFSFLTATSLTEEEEWIEFNTNWIFIMNSSNYIESAAKTRNLLRRYQYTAHHEIDLARPEQNRHTSGFMDIERDWLHFITTHGYIDTFRHFNKAPDNYTWWDMKTRSRDRNIGWRIDYFFVSQKLEKNLINAQIHANVPGSDHAPISLEIEI
jgi:exodeoxyribonuclease III